MVKLRSAVIVIENVLIGFIALFLLALLLDLADVWNATSSYPWGPNAEGPMEGAWNYTSKTRYLASGVVTAAVIGVTLLSTFLIKRGWRIFGLLGGIAALRLSGHLLELEM